MEKKMGEIIRVFKKELEEIKKQPKNDRNILAEFLYYESYSNIVDRICLVCRDLFDDKIIRVVYNKSKKRSIPLSD
jgi:hypothetical protein